MNQSFFSCNKRQFAIWFTVILALKYKTPLEQICYAAYGLKIAGKYVLY